MLDDPLGVISSREMSLKEIVFPETQPETEWVRGRALQKVSPTYSHSVLQGEIYMALRLWSQAAHTGRVGSEWRFRVHPPGEIVRPLVPDVSFLSFDDLPEETHLDDVAVPLGAPTVAVEILSPDDRRPDVDDKISTFLRAGTSLVIVVDFKSRSVELHDARGVTRLGDDGTIVHPAMPGFTLPIGPLLAAVR